MTHPPERIEDTINLKLSKSEALILFEWLSRNWELNHWENQELFLNLAEKQVLILLENNLASILEEPFNPDYSNILSKCYLEVSPNSEEDTINQN